MPQTILSRFLNPWFLAYLAYGAIALYGPTLPVMEWLDTLPFGMRLSGKIAFILLFFVVPFVALVLFMGRRKPA